MVHGKPRRNVCETTSQPLAGCTGAFLSSQATWESEIGRQNNVRHCQHKKGEHGAELSTYLQQEA
jgi:hypothetical protein